MIQIDPNGIRRIGGGGGGGGGGESVISAMVSIVSFDNLLELVSVTSNPVPAECGVRMAFSADGWIHEEGGGGEGEIIRRPMIIRGFPLSWRPAVAEGGGGGGGSRDRATQDLPLITSSADWPSTGAD